MIKAINGNDTDRKLIPI